MIPAKRLCGQAGMLSAALAAMICSATIGAASDYTTATGMQIETDLGVAPLTRPGEGKSLRYRRALWELNDEYNRGGLTRPEYIQRKRNIEDLYD
jgi:hypothetical protein